MTKDMETRFDFKKGLIVNIDQRTNSAMQVASIKIPDSGLIDQNSQNIMPGLVKKILISTGNKVTHINQVKPDLSYDVTDLVKGIPPSETADFIY